MDLQEAFELARNGTEILRARKNLLFTFGATRLPYLCFSEQEEGMVAIREGEVTADRPAIAVPGKEWNFEGFEMEGLDEDGMVPVFLQRGVHIPPQAYTHSASGSRVVKGDMRALIDRELDRLESEHDTRTGVIRAPEAVWKMSLLLYVGAQIARSAPSNVAEHFERLRLRGH